jgi:hypothetical protein
MRNLTEDDFKRVDSVMAAFQAAMLRDSPDAEARNCHMNFRAMPIYAHADKSW